jgi:hypothetical protein
MGFLMRMHGCVLVASVATACSNEIAVDLSIVEAAPMASVTLAALWVDEDGERTEDTLAWALCTARRPLAELGPIAEDCFDDAPELHTSLGVATSVLAEMPGDACRLFGPDPPPSQPGQPQGRPVDPDHTGGYYQPVIVDADDDRSMYGVRLDCGVAGATQAQALELRMRHRDNLAPVVEELARVDGDEQTIDPDAILQVDAGARVDLRVQWPACEADTSCSGAEWYARFDPVTLAITDTREAISVAWYATAGEIDAARSGRDADDPARTSENTWTAPATPGMVTLWIVLRDDRGGSSWRTLNVDVSAS